MTYIVFKAPLNPNKPTVLLICGLKR